MRTMDESTLARVAEFNIAYQKTNGRAPSFRRIMEELEIGSLATVRRYVMALERDGRIRRTRAGAIQLLPQLQNKGVTLAPLVGQIACGEPNFGEEYIEESYALPKTLFGDGELFLLRTFGNSMIEAGIEEGDLIVLRKQNTAQDGDIVVALVEGNTTLKRFYRAGKKIILHPENKKMQDIEVDECRIQGVLVSCIKMY